MKTLIFVSWDSLQIRKQGNLFTWKQTGRGYSMRYFREAGMVQWWERLPPTNVAWVWFPNPVSYVGWVCCWFSSLFQGFFSRFSSLLPPQKPTFQIPIRSGFSGWIAALWMCHCKFIFILIYFILCWKWVKFQTPISATTSGLLKEIESFQWNKSSYLYWLDFILHFFFLPEMYGLEDGGIPATFFVLYMIGWKPHESQVNDKHNNKLAIVISTQYVQSSNYIAITPLQSLQTYHTSVGRELCSCCPLYVLQIFHNTTIIGMQCVQRAVQL